MTLVHENQDQTMLEPEDVTPPVAAPVPSTTTQSRAQSTPIPTPTPPTATPSTSLPGGTILDIISQPPSLTKKGTATSSLRHAITSRFPGMSTVGANANGNANVNVNVNVNGGKIVDAVPPLSLTSSTSTTSTSTSASTSVPVSSITTSIPVQSSKSIPVISQSLSKTPSSTSTSSSTTSTSSSTSTSTLPPIIHHHPSWYQRLYHILFSIPQHIFTPKPHVPAPPPPFYTTVHRVVILGVHGWSILGGILGDPPLLISTRFCYLAKRALITYLWQRGVDLSTVEITCIPLSGHGRIDARIEQCMEEHLPPHRHTLSHADTILFIGHSQGAMVTPAVMYRVITQKWINPQHQHITFLSLAGLHHGPFPDLYGDMYAATKELFHFSHAYTELSKRHMQEVQYLLEDGIRILFLAAAHDQAVPIYSALGIQFGAIPNIGRAIYIDQDALKLDFLTALLCIAVYLYNTGQSSDFLVHISGFLRGHILERNGGAHSGIHREQDAYNLFIEFALSGRGTHMPGGVLLNTHSFSHWSHALSDGFTAGKFNRHMMEIRTRELLQELYQTNLNAQQQLLHLHTLFSIWSPTSKRMQLVRETLMPIFGQTPLHTMNAPTTLIPNEKEKEKDKDKDKDKEKDTPSPSTTTSPSTSTSLAADAIPPMFHLPSML